ncbi:MAG TPA: MFS transporter, partial [Thermoanaerobaculia bacterium]|nr:MFS transporter [Thermoanaerobaculia bacterium]
MPSEAPRAHPLRALRHRNFKLFFTGQLISLIGTWMQQVAQSWLIFRLTHSPLLLGFVGFAGQIPSFILGPIGGHIADAFDRRRTLVMTQSASMILAFILAALTLAGRIQNWHIFLLAALLGVVNAVDVPVRQAFLVQMVEREDLMNAIALNSSMFNGARIVGPAVAGLLVAAIGEGWCFFANAVSYIAVIIGLIMMSPRTVAPQSISSSPLANIVEGFRYVTQTAPIRALLLLLGLASFAGMPYTVLMPVFADDIFHSGARGLGILMGASGVGALIGSVMLAMRATVRGLGRWVAIASASFGLFAIAFAFSRSFMLSVIVLVPLGIAMMVQMVEREDLMNAIALNSSMFNGARIVGPAVAGLLVAAIGEGWCFFANAVSYIAVIIGLIMMS